MAERDEDERQGESRRILERMARESDAGGASFLARAAKGARDHVGAADTDPSDRIEYWGTRIGRGLGLALAVAMVAWLVLFLVRGG